MTEKSKKTQTIPLENETVKISMKLIDSFPNHPTPTVSANAVSVNNQPITFTYSTEQNGTYGSMPSFTEAGTYTVYFKATAPNHNDATGSFTVTVDKATITEQPLKAKLTTTLHRRQTYLQVIFTL